MITYYNTHLIPIVNTANLKGKYFTFDKAFQVEGGGYKIRTRMGDAIRMKDVWLDIPEIEGSMVRKLLVNSVTHDYCIIITSVGYGNS